MDNVQFISPNYYAVYLYDVNNFLMRNCTVLVTPSGSSEWKVTLGRVRSTATVLDSTFIGTTPFTTGIGMAGISVASGVSTYTQYNLTVAGCTFINITAIISEYGNMLVENCSFNASTNSAIRQLNSGNSGQNTFIVRNNYFRRTNQATSDGWAVTTESNGLNLSVIITNNIFEDTALAIGLTNNPAGISGTLIRYVPA